MKKISKLLALLLALCMCFALAACGDAGDGNDDVSNDPGDLVSDDANGDGDNVELTDYEYIMDKGTLIIGYTDYEPMNYVDANGELTGFDTEFAVAVCEKLGVEPEFIEIIWESKEIELNARSIDCVWNGMTIDEERSASMSISLPYVKNAQVIVVRADSGITSTADLIGKTVVAEIGSAGEKQIIGDSADENLAQAVYIGMSAQTDCLLEIKAGTADAAVVDLTLARTMVGEGTDYAELIMIQDLELNTEEYGIAFRKGSDITKKVNDIIKELVEDGTLVALAEKYDVTLSPSIYEG